VETVASEKTVLLQARTLHRVQHLWTFFVSAFFVTSNVKQLSVAVVTSNNFIPFKQLYYFKIISLAYLDIFLVHQNQPSFFF
jgi:hypothetical protein